MIITQWSHDGCSVYNGPTGSMDSASLSIADHSLWCLSESLCSWEQGSPHHPRVSYFSQFPTCYRYPGIVTSSSLLWRCRDKCHVTWQSSHRSNGNMSPVCQLAHSGSRFSQYLTGTPWGWTAGCTAHRVFRLSLMRMRVTWAPASCPYVQPPVWGNNNKTGKLLGFRPPTQHFTVHKAASFIQHLASLRALLSSLTSWLSLLEKSS